MVELHPCLQTDRFDAGFHLMSMDQLCSDLGSDRPRTVQAGLVPLNFELAAVSFLILIRRAVTRHFQFRGGYVRNKWGDGTWV